ncbi:MAG: ATP-binding protein [bacterium]|nr:ATP-binding protein [bacterium]
MEELALHILDIVQNSVRAGAKLIKVAVVEDTAADRLEITIEDDGSGMDEETVKQLRDPFFTTRDTRPVGLGIPLLTQMAQLCDGDVQIESELGEGTKLIATFGHGHIDRPPLGDIAITIWTIVVSNPRMDFEYVHKIDGRAFELNTRELKKLLNIRKVFTPKFSMYLSDYIRENEEELTN